MKGASVLVKDSPHFVSILALRLLYKDRCGKKTTTTNKHR